MRLNLLPFLAFASPIIADGKAIITSLSTISNATISLQSAVASWKGDLLGIFPVVAASTTLLNDINAGTKVAESSANLTLAEVINLVAPTNTLVADVQSALAAVTEAREKFAKLLLAPIIKIDLELEKSASDKFSAAVVSKVPAAFQALASSLTAPIDVAFDYAIGNLTGIL